MAFVAIALGGTVLLPPSARAGTVELWRGAQLQARYDRVQKAVDAAQPGDSIRLRAGVYFENIECNGKSGRADAPIVLEGAPNEKVIIDGAYEPLTRPGGARWVRESGLPPGVYSTPFPFSLGTSTAYHMASRADESALWTYAERAQFLELYAGAGIYHDAAAGRLYIRLDGDKDPNTVAVNVSSAPLAVLYMPNASHWRVRNLELRHGPLAVVFLRYDTADVSFEDLTVKTARHGILVWGAGRDIAVRRSSLFFGWNPGWAWNDVKLILPKTMEGGALDFKAGEGIEVSDCTIDGYFNGIGFRGSNFDVHHNTIHNIFDDAFEPEHEVVNARIHSNHIFDSFVGVSCAPTTPGPILIYRNLLQTGKRILRDRVTGQYSVGTLFKLGGSRNEPLTAVKVYNNSMTCSGKPCLELLTGSEPWQRFELYNNIFASDSSHLIEDSGLASDGNRFDGNLYFRKSGGMLIRRWNSTQTADYTTLQAARDSADGRACGWEAKGIQADPRFVDPNGRKADMRIAAASPAINAGVPTPKMQGWPDDVTVVDGKPDIGAFEMGQGDNIGARGAFASPRDGGASLDVAGPTGGEPDARGRAPTTPDQGRAEAADAGGTTRASDPPPEADAGASAPSPSAGVAEGGCACRVAFERPRRAGASSLLVWLIILSCRARRRVTS